MPFLTFFIFISDLSRNKWVTGIVDTLLEEMINVSYNTENTWITRDSELLAPNQTMKAHQELLEREGAKIEEAEAPAGHHGQNQGQGADHDQDHSDDRYHGMADDSDSDSVDVIV